MHRDRLQHLAHAGLRAVVLVAAQITILPAQAARIAQETAKTGAAVGVSQSGSTLTIETGQRVFGIDADGSDIVPKGQEKLC